MMCVVSYFVLCNAFLSNIVLLFPMVLCIILYCIVFYFIVLCRVVLLYESSASHGVNKNIVLKFLD